VSFEAEYLGLMPDTVSVEPFVSQDGSGVPSYGPGVSCRARIEAGVGRRTNVPAEESSALAFVILAPYTVDGAALAVTPRDRLTLPTGYSPSTPRIVSAMRANDEDGLHHWELRILMQDSSLRRQITVQRVSQHRDPETRETAETVTLETVVWADVRPISGQETFGEGQRQAWGIVRFEIQLTPDVEGLTVRDRISFDSRVFDILDVRVLGEREKLEVFGKARAE
jgi:head-tail adaptor